MSSPQDKKKRGFDGFDLSKNGSRNDKNSDKAQKTARAAVITAIAVLILFVAALFLNSSFLRQKMTAVTIDNVKYTLTDFNYYYKNMYLQYYQSVSGAGDFGSGMLPDTQQSLKSQVYDEETGETWAEFFERMALEQMKTDNTIYVEAQKAGYQLSDEDKQALDEEMASILSMAYSYGYSDLKTYLKSVYGKGMDEASYRRAAERTYLISSYSKYVGESFIYTPEELESLYTENKDSYDTFSYRYFLVTAETVDETQYTDATELQTAQDDALKAAGAAAESYAATITDEQSFIDAAKSYDPEANNDSDATLRTYRGELLGSTYGDWLKDSTRKTGDVSTFESANGYYVVYYISRSDNHYNTVNAQMILVKPEEIDSTQYADDETAYNDAVEQARAAAEEVANTINDEWVAAGATQDKLTELATTNADKISATDSVLLENVYQTQLPDEVDSWLYDTARQVGDHVVVYSESMGYYILYFAGTGKQYSDVLADNGKRTADLQAWKDGLTVIEPKETWLITLASM